MPCSSGYETNWRDEYAKLVPLLCEACDLLEAAHVLDERASDGLRAWAKEHEKSEVERVRREALAKLTPKERRALGLEPTEP